MDIRAGTSAGALSNFVARPFVFRGVQCNSMEGLLQGLKFKNPDMQREVCLLVGKKAKFKGKKKRWWEDQILWWQGEPIKRESDEYQQLLDEAYVALFTTNKKAMKALMDTGSAVLKHSIGSRDAKRTVLTQQEFCSRLTNIRTELLLNKLVEF